MSDTVPLPKISGSQKICWLASFPKSGNTWTRLLLYNLLNNKTVADEDSPINALGSISSNRPQFDNLTGLTSSDLTDDEVDILRPDAYRMIADNASDLLFIKVHDAYHCNFESKPVFPSDCSFGAIYLVRNPLDVVVSYAHHQGHENFEKVTNQLNAADHEMAGGHQSQLRQKTFGWAGHYQSWHQQNAIPVLTIRYEDMIANTAACLTRIAAFIGLNDPKLSSLIENAVEQSSFKKMQEREDLYGFRERPEKSKRFFRSGRTGEGAESLPADIQRKLVGFNLPLMKELGYI